jgi:hypothetical protein
MDSRKGLVWALSSNPDSSTLLPRVGCRINSWVFLWQTELRQSEERQKMNCYWPCVTYWMLTPPQSQVGRVPGETPPYCLPYKACAWQRLPKIHCLFSFAEFHRCCNVWRKKFLTVLEVWKSKVKEPNLVRAFLLMRTFCKVPKQSRGSHARHSKHARKS